MKTHIFVTVIGLFLLSLSNIKAQNTTTIRQDTSIVGVKFVIDDSTLKKSIERIYPQFGKSTDSNISIINDNTISKTPVVPTKNDFWALDTLIFNDLMELKMIDSANRQKTKALLYIDRLKQFNTLSLQIQYVDVQEISIYLTYLESTQIDWSVTQKTYIEDLVKAAKYNIRLLQRIKDKVKEMLRERRVELPALDKLKGLYEEPIQQKYLTEIIDYYFGK
jgi:hypothetical protein